MIENNKVIKGFVYFSLFSTVSILLIVFIIIFLVMFEKFSFEIENDTITSGVISGLGSLIGGIIGAIVALLIVNIQFNNHVKEQKMKDKETKMKYIYVLISDLRLILAKIKDCTSEKIDFTNITFRAWNKLRYEAAVMLSVKEFKQCEGIYCLIQEKNKDIDKNQIIETIDSLIGSLEDSSMNNYA